jgi:hypothetical protein
MDAYCGSKQRHRHKMGKYTAWDDPIVDQTVEEHLQQIVTAVRSRIEPQAIILRGSFSRGEGSVVIEGNRLRFLSDYELVAITPHRRHRRWLRQVARQMTQQLRVETSISRYHPRELELDNEGHFVGMGYPNISISGYEVQSSGLTLYGEDLLSRGKAFDARSLSSGSALRLIVNRMAESLSRLSHARKDWDGLRWINKTVLACAEVLLTVHRQYHFSYEERGRRFAALAPELGPVVERAGGLPEMVRRATEFKLRPSLELYPEPMSQLWQQVRQACDATFRCVIEDYLGFSFDAYAEFPECYLSQLRMRNKMRKGRLWPVPAPLARILLLVRESLHAQRWPTLRLVMSTVQSAYQVVFAIIPPLFLEDSDEVLQEARRWLEMLGTLDPPRAGRQEEQAYLRDCAEQAWKDFCYGR